MSISAITAWEVAMLVEKGRLTLTMDVKDWIDTVTTIEGVRFVPVDNEVAIQSVRLPGEFHPDPADRIIVSLARRLSAALVTSDAKIRAYKHVKTRLGLSLEQTCKADHASDVDRLAVVELRWRK